MSQNKIWLKWDQNTIIWDQTQYYWDQVFILGKVTEALGSGSGGVLVDRDRPWQEVEKKLKKKGLTDEEREKFLKIVIEINGLVLSQTKTLDSIKKEITVEHIRKTLAGLTPSVQVVAKKVHKQ